MPQSLARVLLHIVFSTKGRAALLKDPELRSELYKYQGGILNKLGCIPILINGVDDHVHLLCALSRTISMAELIEKLKSASTSWVKKQGALHERFAWQSGYGVFSVSESMLPVVKKYVENQEEHHKRMSFQEEFRAICEKHGIKIDERYVWD